MAKGTTYPHERIAFTDARTEVSVLQLTSFPTINFCLTYYNNNFTPDSRALVFVSQREARRDAPFDLFRVDVDGTNLTQLTASEGSSGFVLSPEGNGVYFLRGNSLWRVDIESFQEEERARADVPLQGNATISPDGKYYFAHTRTAEGKTALVRISTVSGEVREMEAPAVGSWQLHSSDPGGAGLLAMQVSEQGKAYHLLDYDFCDKGVFTVSYDFAHCTFLGRTGRIQGCALPPDRAVLHLGLGEEQPTPIARGVYFWHSSSTGDSEWIIADTNWPDEGLQLVHVPTGHYRPLCYPRSSQGHPQWTHPHPQFSPDGKVVVFNSDRTGICQIYLARIPDELRERVRSGQLSAKERRLW